MLSTHSLNSCDSRPQHWPAFSGPFRAAQCVALAILLLQSLVPPSAADESQPPPRPDVLLVTIDCLRADHAGCYGYGRNTTPNLDALARRGVRFDSAFASSSWTLPSVGSLMTGRHPPIHGAVAMDRPLRRSVPTMAELLGKAGYSTGAIVNIAYSAPGLGLGRGFDFYETFRPEIFARTDHLLWLTTRLQFALIWLLGRSRKNATPAAADAVHLTEAARSWLNSASDRPRFSWVHYLDPHFPYEKHEPHYSEFHPEPVPEGIPDFTRGTWPTDVVESIDAFTPEMKRHAMALYDSEVRYTDEAIGRLLESLDLTRTVVILTADHGEEFGEHGRLDHGHNLNQELIRVPLVIAGPSWPAGRVVTLPVSLVDLLPTVLEIAGVPPAPTDGVPLQTMLNPSPANAARAIWSVAQTGPSDHGTYSLIRDRWHGILEIPPSGDKDATTVFYDWRNDRDEQRHWPGMPEELRLLERELWRFYQEMKVILATPGNEPIELDADSIKRLKSLGYLR